MHTEEKYNDIDKLIASYLSNELDEKSFSELKRWSMESETNRIYVRDQLEIWFSSGVLSDKTFLIRMKHLIYLSNGLLRLEGIKDFDVFLGK